MDPITLIIVCPLVFLGGFVDSIAGGGGLITLTAYLLAGLPPHTAIATNKLSSCVGTAAATFRLAMGGYINPKLAAPAVVGALAGSVVGARLALLTPEGVFQVVLVAALPVVAFAVLRKRTFGLDESVDMPFRRRAAIVLALSLAIGCYDGFYGPGTGTFMMIAFIALAQMGSRDAAGITKAANLASNVAALVMFLHAGVTWIALGLIAAVFSVAGNYLGAGMVMKGGMKIVRPIIIVVLCMLFVKVLVDLLV